MSPCFFYPPPFFDFSGEMRLTRRFSAFRLEGLHETSHLPLLRCSIFSKTGGRLYCVGAPCRGHWPPWTPVLRLRFPIIMRQNAEFADPNSFSAPALPLYINRL